MSGFLGDHFSAICVFDANAGLGHLRELRRLFGCVSHGFLREGEPRILCWITPSPYSVCLVQQPIHVMHDGFQFFLAGAGPANMPEVSEFNQGVSFCLAWLARGQQVSQLNHGGFPLQDTRSCIPGTGPASLTVEPWGFSFARHGVLLSWRGARGISCFRPPLTEERTLAAVLVLAIWLVAAHVPRRVFKEPVYGAFINPERTRTRAVLRRTHFTLQSTTTGTCMTRPSVTNVAWQSGVVSALDLADLIRAPENGELHGSLRLILHAVPSIHQFINFQPFGEGEMLVGSPTAGKEFSACLQKHNP